MSVGPIRLTDVERGRRVQLKGSKKLGVIQSSYLAATVRWESGEETTVDARTLWYPEKDMEIGDRARQFARG